ncbi:Glucose/sorbosone dehydrogenases-like protein [Lysobacter dokdonensis DS-58]|uniref:Glucose/sorbosone dehydrogenases-like protein n=1 Tax=Lysobacter dokdonensis DS-58 TaxID=1300345 RepID=A0A0A2WE83_9GAMM|nr:PQQ-dependent sugar dehydrogenase [Lysobacter dokdonensis]KGQ18043.1 Glucose/sorbosone dehydrogenases-like protein [Lysobacter dokdonensis DS-58]
MTPRNARMLLFAAGALALAACGGSGTSGSITFGNTPPSFTSPSSVSVQEDTTGAFYNATATDIDGNAISYAIDGGEDASQFRITTAGALSFAVPPDFEVPTDIGGNNQYQVTLRASDGSASTAMALTVTVTDRSSLAFRVRRVASGISSPVFVAPVPDNSGRVYVGELAGLIRILSPGTGTFATTPVLDLRGQLSTNGERGLLGFATSPDFASSGQFFVFVTDPVGTIEVRRYTMSAANRDIADPASMRVILRQPHPRTNHNGGWIGFDRAGFLYVAIGDGGGAGDPDNNGQNRDTWLGKILRIDITRDSFPGDDTRNYGIPTDNPFAQAGGAPEVWALGLRNPFRASFDFGPFGTGEGGLILGDVGENTVEEINVMVGPTDNGGVNFGWSVREGTLQFKGADDPSFRLPAAQYLHGTGDRAGSSIIGGVVYRGPVESLRGQYLFADFIEGNLWSLPIDAMYGSTPLTAADFTVRNTSFAPDAGAFNNPVAFGTDQSGNVYIVDLDGEIFIIESAPAPVPGQRLRARGQSQAVVTRHWCGEAWDGRTVRWIGGEMVIGGQGFVCVRKYYDELAAKEGR